MDYCGGEGFTQMMPRAKPALRPTDQGTSLFLTLFMAHLAFVICCQLTCLVIYRGEGSVCCEATTIEFLESMN